MKVTVIGKKHVHFYNDSKEKIELWKVFVTHRNPFSDDITEYEGLGCSEISLPEAIYSNIAVDCKYDMEFDRKGKLLEVTEL